MKVPPVIQGNVANGEECDEDPSRPLGLETNNNHHASDQREQGHKESQEGKFTGQNEAHEEEYKKNSSGQLNVHALVVLRERRESSEQILLA